ncbi:uncharacterized protein LOC113343822 [Papaver somniferum]|uniref:uncharacterized protein LOC113343822 n=1 Tax=Papaver somniferum TaxID=3469 RepID=UPI000E70227F|nr:uncharacterized protein LOC113343822 [Papaver somniferum]
MKYPKIYKLSKQKKATIKDIVQNDTWNILLSRNLAQIETTEMLALFADLGTPPVLDDEATDELRCTLAGGFSAKTCYNWLVEQLPALPNKIPVSCIWIQYVPPKVQFFLWSAALNAIPTLDNLMRRGCQVQNQLCPMCQMHSEIVNHLFLHCAYASKVWNYFLKGYDVSWLQGETLIAQLEAWKFRRGRNMGRKLWPLVIFAICWSIWDERNRRVMAHMRLREDKVVITEVKLLLYNWGTNQNWFHFNSFRELVTH